MSEEKEKIKTTYEPPKCPNCNSNLFYVIERERIVYKFDYEKGKYKEEDGELEIFCPECDEDLLDIFPDGVCNYNSVKNKNE
jgi:Zn finger protein HypA/HybF involved in hydrogenase expression